MKLTRRQLAAVVSATAMAQAQSGGPAASAPEELESARQRLKANAEALARQAVPMETEPAFQFKV